MITKLEVQMVHAVKNGVDGAKRMAQLLREIADKLETGSLPYKIDDEQGHPLAVCYWEARPS